MSRESEVSMLWILYDIGFDIAGNYLQYDFGNCQLKAFVKLNQKCWQGIYFIGQCKTDKITRQLQFSIPLNVTSYEQGLAFLAFHLRKAELAIQPDWLQKGLTLQENLPWRKISFPGSIK